MEFCKRSSTYSRDTRKKNPPENEKKNLRERNNIFCVGKQKTMHREREREREKEIDKFNYNKMVRIRKKKGR